jgi:hypothetical protein
VIVNCSLKQWNYPKEEAKALEISMPDQNYQPHTRAVEKRGEGMLEVGEWIWSEVEVEGNHESR